MYPTHLKNQHGMLVVAPCQFFQTRAQYIPKIIQLQTFAQASGV